MINFQIRDEGWVAFVGGIVIGFLACLILIILLLANSPITLNAGFAEYPSRNLVCAVNDNNQILSCFDNATIVVDDEE